MSASRERLRYVVLCAEGAADGERALAALAADAQLDFRRYNELSAMVEALGAMAADLSPVAIVLPGGAAPEEDVVRLLEARADLQVGLVTPVHDRRTLAEHFRNLPVPARQVELLSVPEEALAERVRRLGGAVVQRAAHRRAIQRTGERLTGVRVRALDLTAESLRRDLMDSLPVGVIVVNRAGFIVQANRQTLAMLRHCDKGETGAGHGYGHIRQWLPQLGDQPALEVGEQMVTLSGERPRYLLVRTSPLRQGDAPVGAVLSLEDITEQERARKVLRAAAEELQLRAVREARELEQARREQVALRDFVVSLSHDLRTPLSVAAMHVELLQRRAGAADAAWTGDTLSGLDQSLQRINRMVDDLLDVARHDAGGGLDIDPRPTRLDLLLGEVVEDLGRVHGRNFELMRPLPALQGRWDPDGIRRIIENLINNAAKYGDASRPISAWLEDAGEHGILSVRNYGRPIPLEMQQTLFQPFYRAVMRVNGTARGWGVGLAFVRAMAEAHGGSVSLVSDEQSGTVFSVRLPKQARSRSQSPDRSPRESGRAASVDRVGRELARPEGPRRRAGEPEPGARAPEVSKFVHPVGSPLSARQG